MLPTVLLLTVLSAPRAPAGATVVSYVPRIDAMTPLLPFFRAAGSRSNVLRPDAWASDAHALIGLNLLDADALERSGIDGTQSLASCASKLLTLDVLGADNADLAQYTVTLPATPGTSWTFGVAASGGTGVGEAIPVANAVPASVVEGIAIAISG